MRMARKTPIFGLRLRKRNLDPSVSNSFADHRQEAVERLQRMKRIAAIVINSVSHDTRVLKEADSLAAAGYEVAIFGIQDARCSEPLTVRHSGVRIHLCNWKPAGHLLVLRIILAVGTIVVLTALLMHLTMRHYIHAFITSRAFVESASLMWVILLAGLFLSAYWRQRSIVRRTQSERSVEPGPRRSASRLGRLWLLKSLLLSKLKGVVMRWSIKRQILSEIARFAPDAVHCHDLNAVPTGYAYKKRTGCILVFDSHELYEEQSLASPWQKRVYRRWQRYYSGKIDAFVTINDSIARYLCQRYPLLPEPIIIKNATLPPNRIINDDGRLHKAAGLKPDQKILLYQGGFAIHRGLDSLVKSAVLLPDDWTLVMMGWGRFEPELKAIAKSIDPGGRRIRFIPGAPQRELAEWTTGAALGVIPYENVCLNHWYCTPNKLWEYPVAGVPILASPFPELEQTVTKHDIGRVLADPVTPQNIAETVASISDEELSRMRRNCRRYIEQDNWSIYESRLIALYKRLFGESIPNAAVDGGNSLVPLKAAALTEAKGAEAAASDLQSLRW